MRTGDGDGTRKRLIETIAETNRPLALVLETLPTDRRRKMIESLFMDACKDGSDDEAVNMFGWTVLDDKDEVRPLDPAAHASSRFIAAASKIERMPKLRATLVGIVAEWLVVQDQDESVRAFDRLMIMHCVGQECAKSVNAAVRKAIDGIFSAERLLAFISRNPPDDIKKILAAAWAKNSGFETIALGAEIAAMLEGSISSSAIASVKYFIRNNVAPYEQAIRKLLGDIRENLRADESVTGEYMTTGYSKSLFIDIRMRRSSDRRDMIKRHAQAWSETKAGSAGILRYALLSEDGRTVIGQRDVKFG